MVACPRAPWEIQTPHRRQTQFGDVPSCPGTPWEIQTPCGQALQIRCSYLLMLLAVKKFRFVIHLWWFDNLFDVGCRLCIANFHRRAFHSAFLRCALFWSFMKPWNWTNRCCLYSCCSWVSFGCEDWSCFSFCIIYGVRCECWRKKNAFRAFGFVNTLFPLKNVWSHLSIHKSTCQGWSVSFCKTTWSD